ncbi:MAG TPA: V4R domain-containing protein [Gemmatimonadaceae bacterium]|nr:V4R domain-containing protein [Gemmatimonadaceae bacterium]
MSFDLAGNAMVGLTRDALVALRSVLFRDAGANAAAYLQEAGYAGGSALHQAFAKWCESRGVAVPENLTAPDFERHATAFFAELGWGTISVGLLHDSVMTLDSSNWAEADPASAMQFPGCYLSTGLLADFFGRMAGTPLAVMEVECRSMGSERCRFLLGSSETMQYVYDGITTGIPYDASLANMA